MVLLQKGALSSTAKGRGEEVLESVSQLKTRAKRVAVLGHPRKLKSSKGV
jgi:hypothetical protein